MTSLSREGEFRQVLADLELTSCAPTQSFNQGGSHGGFASRDPTTGDNRPPHLYFRGRWDRCESDGARERVLEEAKTELDTLRKRTVPVPPTVETDDQFIKRIAKDGEGMTLAEAALHFRCSPGDVKKARRGDARDLGDGRRLGLLEPETGPERARRLLKAKVSTREIADQLNVSQSQVMKWIRRDEAA